MLLRLSATKSRQLVLLTVLSALATGRAQTSATAGSPAAVRDEATALAALDNSLWVAEGGATDRQIYVFAGTCCEHCHELYQRSRQLSGKVQLRWIPMSPSNDPNCLNRVCEAAYSVEPALPSRIFGSSIAPKCPSAALLDNAMRWNRAVSVSVDNVLRRLNTSGENMVYPYLVWLSPAGLRLAVRPEKLDDIVYSVVARPEVAAETSPARDVVASEFHSEPITKATYYAREDGVEMFALPSAASPLMAVFPKDLGFPAVSRVVAGGEAWIEWQLGDGPVKSSFFVREAQVYNNTVKKRLTDWWKTRGRR